VEEEKIEEIEPKKDRTGLIVLCVIVAFIGIVLIYNGLTTECRQDNDCDKGMECLGNQCFAKVTGPNIVDEPEDPIEDFVNDTEPVINNTGPVSNTSSEVVVNITGNNS